MLYKCSFCWRHSINCSSSQIWVINCILVSIDRHLATGVIIKQNHEPLHSFQPYVKGCQCWSCSQSTECWSDICICFPSIPCSSFYPTKKTILYHTQWKHETWVVQISLAPWALAISWTGMWCFPTPCKCNLLFRDRQTLSSYYGYRSTTSVMSTVLINTLLCPCWTASLGVSMRMSASSWRVQGARPWLPCLFRQITSMCCMI